MDEMNHLSGLDSVFLHTETPETPMHVASLDMLKLPDGCDTDEFYERAKQHVASRMHLAPLFTRKLALMPFEMSNPVWVEDDDIDLDYHIRRVVLPKPGSFEQLERTVARLHSTLLDRSRPLWEFYIFEGLSSGLVALYAKAHHAGVDGQGGIALLNAIMDITPEPRKVKPPRARANGARYQLGVAELANAAFNNTVQQYVKMVKTLPAMWQAVQTIGTSLGKVGSKDANGKRQWLAPRTPFNVTITNQRTFAARSVSLAESKRMAKAAGVSLNDIVMGVSAGALSRYLSDFNKMPSKSLIAAVPVSLRQGGNTDNNNQVTTTLITLATDIADPLERLKAINAASGAAKDLTGNIKAAIPTDFPLFGAPWIMTGLTTMLARSQLIDKAPPVANVLISNVPGPQIPLYFAGARMESFFPVSIPSHGMALNITVQSYNGKLDYGLIGCRRAVPDIEDLAAYLIDEHERLRDLIFEAYPVQESAKPAVTNTEAVTLAAIEASSQPTAESLALANTPMQVALDLPVVDSPAGDTISVPSAVAAAPAAVATKRAKSSRVASSRNGAATPKASAAKAVPVRATGARKTAAGRKPSTRAVKH